VLRSLGDGDDDFRFADHASVELASLLVDGAPGATPSRRAGGGRSSPPRFGCGTSPEASAS
jgi:hypothetical protein